MKSLFHFSFLFSYAPSSYEKVYPNKALMNCISYLAILAVSNPCKDHSQITWLLGLTIGYFNIWTSIVSSVFPASHYGISSIFLDFVHCFCVIVSHEGGFCSANSHLTHIPYWSSRYIWVELLANFFEKFKSVGVKKVGKGIREKARLLLGFPFETFFFFFNYVSLEH